MKKYHLKICFLFFWFFLNQIHSQLNKKYPIRPAQETKLFIAYDSLNNDTLHCPAGWQKVKLEYETDFDLSHFLNVEIKSKKKYEVLLFLKRIVYEADLYYEVYRVIAPGKKNHRKRRYSKKVLRKFWGKKVIISIYLNNILITNECHKKIDPRIHIFWRFPNNYKP